MIISVETFFSQVKNIVRQRKYLLCLILIPFFVLFFICQDYGHKGKLTGTNYTYVGQIQNGRPEGAGTMTFTNGNSYQGNFSKGFFDGAGIYKNKKAKYSYRGNFKNGKADGKGKMTLPDGKNKEIQFKAGVLIK